MSKRRFGVAVRLAVAMSAMAVFPGTPQLAPTPDRGPCAHPSPGPKTRPFCRTRQEVRAHRFTRSDNVTFVQLDETGHEPALDQGALGGAVDFRNVMSQWLTRQKF